jgi:zinc transport system substrate-binding protein
MLIFLLMKRFFSLLPVLILVLSCGRSSYSPDRITVSVSIAPFKFFVDEIGGSHFDVNVMVPPGSDPHIYEPLPVQVRKLRQSEAYIANGCLGFEMGWLDRFHDINPEMKKLDLSERIDLITAGSGGKDGHHEGADPHYWVSPVSAFIIAETVKDLLCELDPAHADEFSANYDSLKVKISGLDSMARELFSGGERKSFMIYHPNLAYLARDYGLEELSVEHQGKEPTPSRFRELIDRAVKDSLNMILVQKEFDTRNARAIAGETGARIVIIDPLSADWLESTKEIIMMLHDSFNQ